MRIVPFWRRSSRFVLGYHNTVFIKVDKREGMLGGRGPFEVELEHINDVWCKCGLRSANFGLHGKILMKDSHLVVNVVLHNSRNFYMSKRMNQYICILEKYEYQCETIQIGFFFGNLELQLVLEFFIIK